MARRILLSPLADELERFQREIRSLAMEIAHSIFRVEFQRRIEGLKASLETPAPRPRRLRRPKSKAPAVADPPVAVAEPVASPPSFGHAPAKRGWTRDSIINELASFLASGTTIDASFVNRYGPRGLVAATKREFGRFEAALNVASLRVAQLYPDKQTTGA